MPINTSLTVVSKTPQEVFELGVGIAKTPTTFRATSQLIGRLDVEFLNNRKFSAKVGESIVFASTDSLAVVGVGLGEVTRIDLEGLRKAGASLARSFCSTRSAVLMDDFVPKKLDFRQGAQAFVEGILLASYEFKKYKSKSDGEEATDSPKEIFLVSSQAPQLRAAVSRAICLSDSVCIARDLVNEPASSMTPQVFARTASEYLQARGVEVEVWDEKRIAKEKLGGVIGVSKGSIEPPRFLTIKYGTGKTPIVLVGKGVTFDSGGLSLKTASGMETMKTDMSGAACVVATISCLAQLKAKVSVVGLVPLVENMPSGSATKPGDVLKARNGKTIEVLNTDAEGRLILADALSIACELDPVVTIDLATLTGACIVALGDRIAGIMGNDNQLIEALKRAGDRSGEELWHLPLPSKYRKHIDSEIADVKNVGASGGQAGTLTAGLFLQEFAPTSKWAHIDMAGPARSTIDEGVYKKGASGFGVRTLVDFISNYSQTAKTR